MLRWFLFGKESLGAFFLDFLPQVFLAFFSGCCSVTKSCLTLCDPMDYSTQASLSFTISWSLLKLMSIESVMPSNHLILCCPLLLPPSIFSSIQHDFPMSQFFASGGQSIGVSVSASVLSKNIQD